LDESISKLDAKLDRLLSLLSNPPPSKALCAVHCRLRSLSKERRRLLFMAAPVNPDQQRDEEETTGLKEILKTESAPMDEAQMVEHCGCAS